MKMKVLYLECNAGVSGDMLMGALTDLMPEDFDLSSMVSSIGIPRVKVIRENTERAHLRGVHAKVLIDGKEEAESEPQIHHHRKLEEILDMIRRLAIPEDVKEDAIAIYRSIADAESEAHGVPVSEVHLHEVGMLDAIADIVIDCMLIKELAPDTVIASPIRTGFGYAQCAHGSVPIPAPATASLLKGIPCYAGDEEGEFATPTGVAILKHFSDGFGQRPTMSIDNIGKGLGTKEFRIPNVLRAFNGQAEQSMPTVTVLECNIDDMTPEDLGGVIDLLLADGALDVTVSSVLMKKGRLGHLLKCLCRREDRDRLAKSILSRTSTIGIRFWEADRYEMVSRKTAIQTSYGKVGVKVSEGYSVRKWKFEHDDLKALAEKNGMTVDELRKKISSEISDDDII